MTLYTVFLWLYSAMASLVFGGQCMKPWSSIRMSRKPPESFVAFMGTPVAG